ncbi:type IV pilin [Halosimplex halobium]|uniref:type IV pilin n=1 Tax=Halosimplex halobium TaxID=3396618 RepID=UPI003F54F6F4
MSRLDRRDRGLSPVIGATLLVAIVVVLAVVAGGVVLGLTEEREPAPEVRLSLESAGDLPGEHALVHDHGEALDGDDVRLRGVANDEALAGADFAAADSRRVYATDETVEVVWFGDHDTSYVLQEFTVDADATVPSPDEGCDWVDAETDGGTDDAKVDGIAVACDVETDKVIELQNGGAVVGDAVSHAKLVDLDDSRIYGDVTVEKDVNVQDGTVGGSVRARTENVKVDGATVGGAVRAEKTVEVIDGGSVGGDAESDEKSVKVLDSSVDGSVTADEGVKLDGATVGGEVFVDPAEFDCTDSTIGGEDCSEYSPTDPDA